MNPVDLLQGSSLIWLMGTGLMLGALHALEPGHAKTMIASFVIATRGSVPQAVLLGLSAAFSHSVLIWLLAGAAIYFGNAFAGDDAEPWLQLASGVVIIGIGLAMIWRLNRRGAASLRSGVGPQGGRTLDTGHGIVELAVFEDGVPPEFRLFAYDAAMRPEPVPDAAQVFLRTVRPDGTVEVFEFVPRGACLVSTAPIAEPHAFEAVLDWPASGHRHEHVLTFREDHDHRHGHPHDQRHASGEDAHTAAHARQFERRLDGRAVTTREIALFGLSSGLMPCPAALTMLLVCLRLKKVALGIGLVGAFSLGLAVTLVSLGVVAAIGVTHASRRLSGLDRWAGVLPYVSGALVIGVGLFMGVSGFSHLG